jgi:hypothetical protein
MFIFSVVCSVLLGLLWAALKGDVYGASCLGALVIGLHSVIMTAFLFKFNDIQ